VTTTELIDDYRWLLVNDIALLDVRAPIEFQQGAFPCAVNLPLMDDQERHAVGVRYKQAGQASAIELGHQLVCKKIREQRIERWVEFVTSNPDAVIYCFRGGLRSQIAQQWLEESGHRRPRVVGGYKALRQFLIHNLEQQAVDQEFIVVGGLTGSGKTDVIQATQACIDLEGLAHHRGSSFGGRTQRQPSQIDFENQLSIAFLKHANQGRTRLAIEDESHLIGRCAVPLALRERTQRSPMIWITSNLHERVSRIQRDYIESLAADYIDTFGQTVGFEHYSAHLTKSLFNLRKRLGMQRYVALHTCLTQALARQQEQGDFELHRGWIEPLLTQYYDPMYNYQREQKQSEVIYEGDCQGAIEFLKSHGL
jgi:tRNA 2-selenouridine synthase